MRFQITTDYAIRIVLYVAQHDNKLSGAEEASRQLGMTHGYFNKVAGRIRKAGFLESVQGPGGGYRLARDAEDITLYDIMAEMEGDMAINRCMEEDGFCSRGAVSMCPVHRVFESLQRQMVDTLKRVRISDLCGWTQAEVDV